MAAGFSEGHADTQWRGEGRLQPQSALRHPGVIHQRKSPGLGTEGTLKPAAAMGQAGSLGSLKAQSCSLGLGPHYLSLFLGVFPHAPPQLQ